MTRTRTINRCIRPGCPARDGDGSAPPVNSNSLLARVAPQLPFVRSEEVQLLYMREAKIFWESGAPQPNLENKMSERLSTSQKSRRGVRTSSGGLEIEGKDYHMEAMIDNGDEWGDAGEDEEDDEEEDGAQSLPSSVASTVESSRSNIANKNAKALAEQRAEEKRVFSLKIFVVTLFLIVSIGVSLAIYGFVNQQENEIFETKFRNQADQLFDASRFRMSDFFIRLGNLGVSFAAQVEASADLWPFVLISTYETQVQLFSEQQTPVVARGPLLLSVIVRKSIRESWEQYSVAVGPSWIKESYEALNVAPSAAIPSIAPFIYRINFENETKYEDHSNASVYSPFWMISLQAGNGSVEWVNYNSLDDDLYAEIEREFETTAQAEETKSPLLVASPSIAHRTPIFLSENINEDDDWPQSTVATALFDSMDKVSRQRVATLSTRIAWHAFFQDILQDNELVGGSIIMALEDTCGRAYMYSITGSSVDFTGAKADPDLPMSSTIPIHRQTYNFIPMPSSNCSIIVHLAASEALYEASGTKLPMIFAVSVLAIFAVVAIIFWFYDRSAGRTYNNALHMAQQSVRHLRFLPKPVRDRLNVSNREVRNQSGRKEDDEDNLDEVLRRSRHRGEKAIADLHPNVTVLYADIANFTAWSSVREPAQVFQLLETLYHAFDLLCSKYKIFKVETVGDSYVAVSGIPVAVDEHAVNMARFSREMMSQMRRIVNQLEVALGPETAELTLRIGMNSGPVTAGVLRGEKSRFQLFGETVNTASRMEGTGMGNCIQVSGTTAELLKKFGKGGWLIPREDLVEVKGRGAIRTYWLRLNGVVAHELPTSEEFHAVSSSSKPSTPTITELDARLDTSTTSGRGSDGISMGSSVVGSVSGDKTERLVDWCADLLLSLLKKIVAMRESEDSYNELREFQEIVRGLDDSARDSVEGPKIPKRASAPDFEAIASLGAQGVMMSPGRSSFQDARRARTVPSGRGEPFIFRDPNKTVLDEVAEIISLPRKTARYQQDPNKIELSSDVVRQLYRFVREVAKMYRANPFHNFQHASHVTMSLTKLLSRVVAPDEVDYEHMKYKKKVATAKLHKFTFGITSDPITQFACAFSSMIHDMDHPGVPNGVLVSEGTEIAKHYRNKSVAEQNSVDLAWNLLMESKYKDLRQCIYRTQSELERFRQLVVNSVMATDIVDKELGQLRKNRWERAFNKNPDSELDEKATDEVNRKATIVIEHLIQAADVAHTMQHWHVYVKWNERFFQECYAVYLSGRSQTDPSEGWYKGEIGFFDFYIIPLAKKLESCGVFGVSSDECLSYAKANRDEWERKGEEIVKGYVAKYGSSSKNG